MKAYLDLVQEVLSDGILKHNRTGVDALTISGAIIKHDMKNGFPLLTTKKMAKKSMMVELEGFIKGINSKKWYQERGCNIWNEWSNPQKAPYGNDEESKRRMLEEDDLGSIYGVQWRNFNSGITKQIDSQIIYEANNSDQLKSIVDKLHNNPTDRRMICSAWNPLQLDYMALPPCHILWNIVVINDTINLNWYQRSCDLMLGIPFNLSSYALLLHLLAKESGLKEGKVCGMLGDVHVYENHIEGAKEQLKREPFKLCSVHTDNFDSIFNWTHKDTIFMDYKSHDKINFDIAV